MSVPEIVEADTDEAVCVCELPEPFRRGVVVDWLPVPGADYVASAAPAIADLGDDVLLVRARLFQECHHARRQVDDPGACVCLRRVVIRSDARRVVETARDGDRAILPVHVVQGKTANFGETKTTEESQQDGAAERERLFVSQAAEQLHGLSVVQEVHAALPNLRRRDAVHRVLRQVFPLDGDIQHIAEGVVIVFDRPVRERPRGRQGNVPISGTHTQLRVYGGGAGRIFADRVDELREPQRRQLRQREITQCGQDPRRKEGPVRLRGGRFTAGQDVLRHPEIRELPDRGAHVLAGSALSDLQFQLCSRELGAGPLLLLRHIFRECDCAADPFPPKFRRCAHADAPGAGAALFDTGHKTRLQQKNIQGVCMFHCVMCKSKERFHNMRSKMTCNTVV